MATRLNIYADQGTDFELAVDVVDESGNPLNLAGYSVTAQARPHYESEDHFDLSAVGHSNGAVVLSMTAAESANVRAARYVYDVVTVSPDSKTSRVLEGVLTIRPGVSR